MDSSTDSIEALEKPDKEKQILDDHPQLSVSPEQFEHIGDICIEVPSSDETASIPESDLTLLEFNFVNNLVQESVEMAMMQAIKCEKEAMTREPRVEEITLTLNSYGKQPIVLWIVLWKMRHPRKEKMKNLG
ncbi:hypothetical protein KIN20_002996 [Parelaphostrongylus tenuis]|uniref:Uncharacterized protein n=1 Tax=Parelaphostrongylus tenuis TaxID=148309 RepID=A0AAD5LZF0_PARTN|nr:hypothetical protein KIN20_002996 [Parelaphostrongylus tenuis]